MTAQETVARYSDEKLASRVRALLADRSEMSERRMCGGLTFMVVGHMCCGVHGDRREGCAT